MGEEEIKMLNAINIPISPEKFLFKKFGDSLKFTLIFPSIPKSWGIFNLIERKQERSKFDFKTQILHEVKGLYINTIIRNNTGVYKVIIQ